MSTTTELLPATADSSQWTDREKAIVEAAGLVSRNGLAPRPTVEAFLAYCRDTGLNPIAKQIYAIERGGKWGIQISIDGARLIAQRTGDYQGQTAAEWTSDGVTWVQAWVSTTPPAAARVGVLRKGFVEPVYGVARTSAYNAGSPIWQKMPDVMIAKCAEALALRKAFPMEMSGLYTSDEMEQATPVVEAQVIEAEPEPSVDWVSEIDGAQTEVELRAVHQKAQRIGELGLRLDDEHTVNEYVRVRLDQIRSEQVGDADTVDGAAEAA